MVDALDRLAVRAQEIRAQRPALGPRPERGRPGLEDPADLADAHRVPAAQVDRGHRPEQALEVTAAGGGPREAGPRVPAARWPPGANSARRPQGGDGASVFSWGARSSARWRCSIRSGSLARIMMKSAPITTSPDLLEPQVPARRDGLAPHGLQQGEHHVAPVEDGDREQIEGHDGDVDHGHELQVRVEPAPRLLAGRLGDEQRAPEILTVVERAAHREPHPGVHAGDERPGRAEAHLHRFEQAVPLDVHAVPRGLDPDAAAGGALAGAHRRHGELEVLPAAPHPQVHRHVRLALELRRQLLPRPDGPAVDGEDQVTLLDPRLVRGHAGRHHSHDRTDRRDGADSRARAPAAPARA